MASGTRAGQASGLVVQPGMLRNRCAASTAFESLPDLLVEVETYRAATSPPMGMLPVSA